MILKTAVAVMKHRSCFDPSTSSGPARTVFDTFTQMVKSSFALSSLRSGRVEGFRTCQLPFLGRSAHTFQPLREYFFNPWRAQPILSHLQKGPKEVVQARQRKRQRPLRLSNWFSPDTQIHSILGFIPPAFTHLQIDRRKRVKAIVVH